jgi:leader peptidase (prepilin peptidase) / N-methyltransferase
MAMAAGLGLVLSAITAAVLRPTAALPAAIVFTIISSLVIGVELHHHRLSRGALMASIFVVLAAQAVGASIGDDPRVLLGSLGGGLLAGLAVLTVHVASPNSLSAYEVRYAALIGTTLGWFGVARVGLGLGLGLVIGAVSAGPLVLVSRRRAEAGLLERPLVTSYAPALAVGAWISLCWGDVIVSWYANGG